MASVHAATTCFAAWRIAVGATLVATPGRVASAWLGRSAAQPGIEITIRAVGTRDLILAAGTLAAARARADTRPWLLRCMASDLADIGSALAAGDRLGARPRFAAIGSAGIAAMLGAALAARSGHQDP